MTPAMVVFKVSESWHAAFPGAAIGTLAMRRVANPAFHAALNEKKGELEQALQSRLAQVDRAGLRALPVLGAYHTYYSQFKKTYHVQLQLESVVLKGKPIPSGAALVEAMFMAELKNLLLTAGHDLESLQMPVGVDVAGGHERYVRLNGQEQILKAGDMMIADAQGVISSILYGPDQRTQLRPETTQVLFTVYAPRGIGRQAVEDHLHDLTSNVLLIAPQAEVISLAVYCAEG